MSLQNRVTPLGEIVATPARGTLMGNRGVLHSAEQKIIRSHQTRRWISCLLAYKDWKRPIMTPNRYTELFFLDELTALAAGHRPCALCRRPAYEAFRAAWQQAAGLAHKPSANEMDAVLHRQRVEKGQKVMFLANVTELPSGVMGSWDKKTAVLLWQKRPFRWTPFGYEPLASSEWRSDKPLHVLTPATIVKILAQGYQPFAHQSLL